MYEQRGEREGKGSIISRVHKRMHPVDNKKAKGMTIIRGRKELEGYMLNMREMHRRPEPLFTQPTPARCGMEISWTVVGMGWRGWTEKESES